MERVQKRDGRFVDFDINRIIQAILSAQSSVGESDFSVAHSIANSVTSWSQEFATIGEIQDYVEKQLMVMQPDVARSYIEHRSKRDKVRESNSPLAVAIRGLVEQTDERILKENANKDAKVFPVQRDLLAGIVSKHFARNYTIPDHIVKAHDSGDIHFHDLDYSPFLPMTNCCLVDLRGMLKNGFRLGNAEIESPRSFGVACAVTAQIIAQVASHQYGGTTIANIDQVLEEYAAASWTKHWTHAMEWEVPDAESYANTMTQKEIYDGCQAMEYEINTLFTTNGQQPFVTFSFGMGTSNYSRWIQQSILSVRLKGLGKNGITAVFPKLVMFLEEGINLNKQDPNYDVKQLALKCSAKRLYPDIISASNNRRITGSSIPVSPMGCRSFLPVWKDEEGVEVLDGRNNLGVISLNLPRIAIESGGNVNKFYEILFDRLELCKQALDVRIDSLRGVKAKVAPILYTEGAFGKKLDPEDDIIQLFMHGRSSISLGYIGCHEVAQIMGWGQENIESLVQTLNLATQRWKKESKEGWGYSLYATPSESLCDRFCRLDKDKFGEMEGITDKGWYTNSFHVDVRNTVNPYDKVDMEKNFHFISTGGFISYAEFPNMQRNLEALENVWDYAMQHLGYYGTNTPSDHCFECGFEGEFKCTSKGFTCPKCSNHDSKKMSIIRRVCGYLGSPNSRGFNEGKNKEVEHRVKHI